MLRDVASALLDLLLPPRCVRCDGMLASAPLLCAPCTRCLVGETPARACAGCGEARRHKPRAVRSATTLAAVRVGRGAPFEGDSCAGYIDSNSARGLRARSAADAFVLALAHPRRTPRRSASTSRAAPADPATSRGGSSAGRCWRVLHAWRSLPDDALRVTRATVSQTGLDRARDGATCGRHRCRATPPS